MAVSNAQVRILVRTARMLAMEEQRPDHNGRRDHKNSITINRAQWDQMPQETRDEVVEAAGEIHDMTPELLAQAVAELES